jgi:hypothetical protein
MATDNLQLDRWIRHVVGEAAGDLGAWEFMADDVPIIVLTDEQHDRMRAMSPVMGAEDYSEADLHAMLEANFDRALDARYALHDGRIWSVFIHPLADLTQEMFLNGVEQVVTLVRTYGSDYTSGGLVFGED